MTLAAQAAYKYQDYLASSNTGRPLPNYYVKFFLTGSTTPETVWTDKNAGTADTNPVRTNSLGFFSAFISPGNYDIRFYSNQADYLADTNSVVSLVDVLWDGFVDTTITQVTLDASVGNVNTALSSNVLEYVIIRTDTGSSYTATITAPNGYTIADNVSTTYSLSVGGEYVRLMLIGTNYYVV